MTQRHITDGRTAGPVAVIAGALVGVLPVVLLGTGGFESGPVAFAVLVMQSLSVLVGLAILGTGLYSYRTGNPRPAVAATTALLALGVVGVVGASVEMSGGPLVPVWAWAVAGAVAIGLSLVVTDRLVD